MQYLEEEFKIYPLWLCPIKQDERMVVHTASTCTDPKSYLVNVGVWGSPNYGEDFLGSQKQTFDRFVENNRRIEAKVAEVGGLKWLYACNYCTKEEFWKIYDKKGYDELRIKWKADRLPDLWEKVRRSRQELDGISMGQVIKALVYAGLGVDRLVMT